VAGSPNTPAAAPSRAALPEEKEALLPMSSGFNQAILLGRALAPAEQLTSKSGKPYVRATIATTVYQKNAEGLSEERTSLVPVTIFGAIAEVFSKYVQKGDLVHVTGRLDSREYKTDSGEKRLSLGMIVEQVHLLPNEHRQAASNAGEGT
jgi:single-strand DNA-binding protein